MTSRSGGGDETHSKSQAVFLRGWLLNRGAFMVPSPRPLLALPLKPPALAWHLARPPPTPCPAKAPPAPDLAHGQLAHGAGLAPSAVSSAPRAAQGTGRRHAPSRGHPGPSCKVLPALSPTPQRDGQTASQPQGPSRCFPGLRIPFQSCLPIPRPSWVTLPYLQLHLCGSFPVRVPGPHCGLWLKVVTSQLLSSQPRGCRPCHTPRILAPCHCPVCTLHLHPPPGLSLLGQF